MLRLNEMSYQIHCSHLLLEHTLLVLMLAAFLAQLGQLFIGSLQFPQQQLMTLLVVLCSTNGKRESVIKPEGY